MMVLTANFLQFFSPGHCCGGALSIYSPLSHGLACMSKPFFFCLQAALHGRYSRAEPVVLFPFVGRAISTTNQLDRLQNRTA